MAIIYWKVDGTTLKLRSGSASGYSDFDDEFPGAPDWASYVTNVTKVIIENNISPSNMYAWFMGCSKVTEIQYIQRINTSNVTDMSQMFSYCNALTSLDLSSFNTSNVTHMGSMFYDCNSLTSLDLSSFNTSKVTNMSYMFSGCYALTSLTLPSSFDTSNVTVMSGMFSNCYALTSLDLSSFDTSNVTSMSNMFYNCRALISLNVSSFDTSKVTDMSDMFYNCYALTSLNVSGFNTSNVTDMNLMFYDCQALTTLDVSGFNTSNVVYMNSMFYNCRALTSLNVSGFDTSNVTSMGQMFFYCPSLTTLDISNFDTSKVTEMDDMFSYCQALTTIIVSSALFKTTQVTSSSNMFLGCTNLIGGKETSYNSSYIDKTYARADDAPTTPGYFTGIANCASLDSTDGTLEIFYTGAAHTNGEVVGTKTYYTDIDQITGTTYPKWYSIRNSIIKITIEDLFKPKTGYYLFSSSSLTSIEFFKYNAVVSPNIADINLYYEYNSETDTYFLTEDQTIGEKTYYIKLSMFDTSNIINMTYMFCNCQVLTSLDLSGFNTSNVINMGSMFQGCWALTTLDVSNFDTSKVTVMYFMFYYCSALTSLDISSFNTSNVTNMRDMFYNCKALTSLDLSSFDTSKVTNMDDMFYGCEELISTPLTPLDLSNFDTSKVTNMEQMFKNCSSLTSLDISNFVFSNNVNINSMFEGCTSLAGAIRINSNPGSYTDMFKDTVEEIVLFGNSTLLNSFTTTANNHNVYVWTLTAQPTANRDNNVGTSVNLSVKIESYAITNNNIIRAIKVYEGDSTNPLELTWDKQFTIDENPKTFTTTITNIDENTTVTYRIQVEDNYGISSFREVIVPTNYYTIDFLKKGKEISFGVKADIDDFYEVLTTIPDDWASNYHNYYKKEGDEYINNTDINFVSGNYYKKIHESLFKCGMDAVFLTETQLFKSMYDIMHPIGSYYESSLTYIPPSQMSQQTPDLDNPTSEDLKALGITWFNPNFIWSGRWELESGGRVHIGSGINEANTTNNWGSYTAGQDTWIAGEKGGETKHLLDETQMPSHTHTQNSHNHSQYEHNHAQNSHSHTAHYTGVNRGGGSTATRVGPYSYTSYPNDHVQVGYTTATNIAATATNIATTATNNNTGGGQAHENMPPYIVVNRWHRVA